MLGECEGFCDPVRRGEEAGVVPHFPFLKRRGGCSLVRQPGEQEDVAGRARGMQVVFGVQAAAHPCRTLGCIVTMSVDRKLKDESLRPVSPTPCA